MKSGTSVTFPETISQFGLNPFGGNGALVNFHFENSLREGVVCILDSNYQAFYSIDYKELKRVAPGVTGTFIIHPDCERIGYAACTSCILESVEFSSNLTWASNYAFYISGIKSFNFSHVYCQDNAFHGSLITSADIPGYWGRVERGIFYATRFMTRATIGNGVTQIESYAFGESLLSDGLQLPDTLEELGTGCFTSCKFMTLTLPTQCLKIIGARAFDTCMNIPDIVIPACVEVVREYAFSGCTNVSSIILENCNTAWTEKSFYGILGRVKPTCIATRLFTAHLQSIHPQKLMLESEFFIITI